MRGKQFKESFKSKSMISMKGPIELLHINLFGSTRITSVSGKRYGLEIVDDYSRWTWVLILTQKDETFEAFCKL